MKHWFSWVIGLGLVGMIVMTLLLSGQNAALRAELQDRDRAIAALAAEGGLRAGDTVEALRLFDADGETRWLSFDGGEPATLLLLVSAGCRACDITLPLWDAMLREDDAGVRVVAVDAGARQPAELGSYSDLYPTWAAREQEVGWLREIPLTPSAVVIGPGGRVLEAWYGARAASRTGEIRAVLDAAVHEAGG
ncbi:MAG: hypothetical protein LAT64_06945 [Phycisphaerales bacterium]|nr:hypothetical protein [Planctomycetota bacterium]MCH8508491.1 hypothetical protein [Phycisphaerales bacterium]